MPTYTVKRGNRLILMRDGVRKVIRGGREVELTADEAKNFGKLDLLEAPVQEEKAPTKAAASK